MLTITDAMSLSLNELKPLLAADKDFLTWLMIGWQLCCQPIRSYVRNLLLSNCKFSWQLYL